MNMLTSRKIISGLVLLVVGVLVVYWKGDIPTNFSTFLQTMYGAFVVGNAFEHYTTMKTQGDKDV